ncbi:phage tail protein [Escherichia coli]|nr:phage tail protein [Escherichia coli]EHA4278984.1 phage tail protein [Escherichia coli]
MAGTNDFKAFATDANANVTSQEEWETLTALKKGFSSGKASSAQVSKALRQPSTMAAVLGQFIANAELDALDDGDVDGLVAKLATAITTNLGLGEAAKRNVGTGENQIPDMSAFPSGKNWFQLPSGHIVQMFSMNVYGADTNGTTGNFPIAFPSGALAVSALWSDGTLTAAPTFKLMGYTTTRTSVTLKVSTGNGLYGTMIIAIGR